MEIKTRRWFWISATATAMALLAALVELPRTPLPWFDEILLVSAARSATLGHPAAPSVLYMFPHTMRSDLFYGPVVFWIGSAVLKVFGLSLWSWRLLGWFSGVAVVLESAWLVLRLGGSREWAAFAALMVTMSPAIGSTITSGRTDTITLAFELLAFCLLLPESSPMRSTLGRLFLGYGHPEYSAGALDGTRFFLRIDLLLRCRNDLSRLRNVCLAGAIALLCVVAWTFSIGLNPVSWYRMVLHASSGDKTNVSPLLGGSWGHLTLDPLSLVLPLGLGTWLVLWALRRRQKHPLGSAGVLLGVVLVNAAIYLMLTSRAFSYQIYWLVPSIPAALAITSLYGNIQNSKRPGLVYVLAGTIVFAGVLRVGKTTEVIASWTARDPRPLKAFVCSQIPQHSRVFGPSGPYYYAVEECGSQYLYAGNWTASGLRSPLDGDDPHYQAGDFLLWPTNSQLPRMGALHEVAQFGTQTDHAPSRSALVELVKRRFPFTGGYPQSILYQVR